MDLTIKIIWIILAVLALYVIYTSVNKIVKVINSKNLLTRDIEMFKMKFSEVEILSHLDFIITECLDYYIAMTLTPKDLYYINSRVETEIINTLGEIVPARISPTLYSQLSLIYDPEQIPTVIGEKIYTKVLEYVIQFNVQNDSKVKKSKNK
jgi:hypothetical protein